MSSSIFVTTNTNTDKRNKYRDELGDTEVATVEGKLSRAPTINLFGLLHVQSLSSQAFPHTSHLTKEILQTLSLCLIEVMVE